MPKEIPMNTAISTWPSGALHSLTIILPLLKKWRRCGVLIKILKYILLVRRDNAENNPFIKEIENTGLVIMPEEEFSFEK